MNGHADLQYLNRPDGATIAYRRLPAAAGNTEPGVVFLCGLKSDMTGTKATALEEHCRRHRPGLRALRLFRPRSVFRRVRGRHDDPLGRRCGRRHR